MGTQIASRQATGTRATGTRTEGGKLAAMAQEMRAAALRTGAVHRPLVKGLQVVLRWEDERWRLALGREGVFPSETEVEVCRRAFAVPEGVETARREASWRHPKTLRAVRWQVVEMSWVETLAG